MKFLFIRHNNGASIFIDDTHKMVEETHPFFLRIMNDISDNNLDNIKALIDIPEIIKKTSINPVIPNRSIECVDDKMYFVNSETGDRQELHSSLVERILNAYKTPKFIKYTEGLFNLLENMMLNKKEFIQNELYDFLTSGKSPITYDGCFLAYKKVKSDYKDIYSGKFDNSPGQLVTCDDFDTDRERICSKGLHFASFDYLAHYSSTSKDDKIVIVKVNPKDVVAIPKDYNYQKGRCSKYEVVGEYISKSVKTKDVFNNSFLDSDMKLEETFPEIEFKTKV